jgi:hypothetical protein
MDRIYFHNLGDGYFDDPPPPYSRKPEQPRGIPYDPTLLEVLIRTIFQIPDVEGEIAESLRIKEEEEERILALYKFVCLNHFVLDLEPGVFSEPCYDVNEILEKFHKYPPRCKRGSGMCCVDGLLWVAKPGLFIVDGVLPSSYHRYEWLYNCECHPHPPPKNFVRPDYWDVESQADVRWSKVHQRCRSSHRGSSLFSIAHVGYEAESDPRPLRPVAAMLQGLVGFL